jgi:hypothetical protein
MNVQKISRSYKRTVTVTMPNGGEAWICHEAAIEAEVNEADQANLGACFNQLEEIAKTEVAGAVNKELAIIESKRQAANGGEPFPGTAPSMGALKQL